MRILYLILVCMMSIGSAGAADGFLRVEGQNIVKPNGERLYIQGTNLGNWLNPVARHYKNETAVLGYGLMNEALATYFNDEYDELTEKLGALYTEAVKAVRQEDKNHIIILGGANWNTRFEMLDMSADEQLMIECHRYGGEPVREAIQNFIEPQQKTNRPMYMGEIGHGTMEWQTKFVQVMKDCNIGYTFWPYKKLDNSCMVAIKRPEGWERIVEFAEGTRNSYAAIREARKKLPQQEAMKILRTFLDNILFDKCMVQEDYVTSMGMK